MSVQKMIAATDALAISMRAVTAVEPIAKATAGLARLIKSCAVTWAITAAFSELLEAEERPAPSPAPRWWANGKA
jgi:hypothetical protein